MKKMNLDISSPTDGNVIKLEQVNDSVFSSEMMGQGFGVVPSNGKVVAPIDGKIVMVADTKHAIGIESKQGVELLIHMGIDTVNLKGEPFEVLISEDDTVKMGQPIANINLDILREKAIDNTIITLVTNSDLIDHRLSIKTGVVERGQVVANVALKQSLNTEMINQDEKLGMSVLEAVGGKDNITGLVHCATRLRFTLRDFDMPNDQKVGDIPGVLGVARAGGQYQVIVGQNVPKVYTAIMNLIGDVAATKTTSVNENKKWFSKLLDLITGIFTPVLPAITGAAMIKTLLIILVLCHVLTARSQTYIMLSFVGDTAFTFLPIFLAYTASKKFGLNPFIGMVLGAMLLHPSWTALVTANKSIHLFSFLPVTLASYGSTVIPIILIIWIASYVDRIADKLSPEAIKFFMQPFLTLLIMVPIAFVFVGPLGFLIGKGLGAIITAIQTNAVWVLPLLFGILAPIFIMTGMHYAVTIPLVLTSISTQGFDMLGIGYLVSNIAQGAAALAVGQASKNTKMKALAFSSGLTALLGITEPALYGVNLKLKKPFIAVMIGGGIGGLIGGIFGVKRMTFAPTGLTTLPVFIDPQNSMNFVWTLVGASLAFIFSYIITLTMVKHDKKLQKQINND
ncbi:glucose PTS transporter subunit IIA [Lactiplantibacillus mudanjiangensis]|uniref:PTS sugar transporter [Lactobacillus farciminis KCTC 3681 = DSM] n=1 Tax=Lactiplantibacillus mudanjiangensis TaxID=1296538 RepID=A0A660E4F2_9LACO|nr:PTS glucose transporter subunit IIABC [Lactiplantibacillus mudanjiangensis]VDG18500.1 PTS sugar transporter [Lactobacillus farciminis KCTC 3681 = DSM] [Lactiplantibacillus mudanjiangensis]VDG25909.1 PTS sugar transporter [Lactobacillus farciminis KCTC 3681 = DSM] [Lactiplantibacillus mudanjiangensis]VDG29623.1 PTS sugar transporter [Lactobacillus farciminis KCTC 3681 = DSM] [Lactiplantibacillus mudanjiangensis]